MDHLEISVNSPEWFFPLILRVRIRRVLFISLFDIVVHLIRGIYIDEVVIPAVRRLAAREKILGSLILVW